MRAIWSASQIHLTELLEMNSPRMLLSTLLVGLLALPAAAQQEPDTTKSEEEELVIKLRRSFAPDIEFSHPTLDSLMADGDVRIERDGRTIVITGSRGGAAHVILRTDSLLRDGLRMRRGRPALMVKRSGSGGQVVVERHVEVDGDSVVYITNFPRRSRSARVEVERRREGQGERARSRDDRSQGAEQSAELRRMEAKARQLVRAVRNADDDERAEHEEALRTHLAEMLDLKLSLEQRMIEEGRERLSKREETLAQRRENRDVIIEDRMNQLLGRGSAYRW